MKRYPLVPGFLALWVSLAPLPSLASPVLRLHGGFDFQTGIMSSDQGIGGGASMGVPIGASNALSLDAAFEYFPISTRVSDDTKATVIPVTLNAEHHFPMSGGGISWLGAGAGLYHMEDHYRSPSRVVQNAPGANVAAGVAIPQGRNLTIGFILKLHYIWGKQITSTSGFSTGTDLAYVSADAVLGFGL